MKDWRSSKQVSEHILRNVNLDLELRASAEKAAVEIQGARDTGNCAVRVLFSFVEISAVAVIERRADPPLPDISAGPVAGLVSAALINASGTQNAYLFGVSSNPLTDDNYNTIDYAYVRREVAGDWGHL